MLDALACRIMADFSTGCYCIQKLLPRRTSAMCRAPMLRVAKPFEPEVLTEKGK